MELQLFFILRHWLTYDWRMTFVIRMGELLLDLLYDDLLSTLLGRNFRYDGNYDRSWMAHTISPVFNAALSNWAAWNGLA
jgi:hypothetical protein